MVYQLPGHDIPIVQGLHLRHGHPATVLQLRLGVRLQCHLPISQFRRESRAHHMDDSEPLRHVYGYQVRPQRVAARPARPAVPPMDLLRGDRSLHGGPSGTGCDGGSRQGGQLGRLSVLRAIDLGCSLPAHEPGVKQGSFVHNLVCFSLLCRSYVRRAM